MTPCKTYTTGYGGDDPRLNFRTLRVVNYFSRFAFALAGLVMSLLLWTPGKARFGGKACILGVTKPNLCFSKHTVNFTTPSSKGAKRTSGTDATLSFPL